MENVSIKLNIFRLFFFLPFPQTLTNWQYLIWLWLILDVTYWHPALSELSYDPSVLRRSRNAVFITSPLPMRRCSTGCRAFRKVKRVVFVRLGAGEATGKSGGFFPGKHGLLHHRAAVRGCGQERQVVTEPDSEVGRSYRVATLSGSALPLPLPFLSLPCTALPWARVCLISSNCQPAQLPPLCGWQHTDNRR